MNGGYRDRRVFYFMNTLIELTDAKGQNVYVNVLNIACIIPWSHDKLSKIKSAIYFPGDEENKITVQETPKIIYNIINEL